jgi:small GTP-binding protein
MKTTSGVHDPRFAQALVSVERALEKFRACSDQEKRQLHADIAQLREMNEKLTSGRVEIAVFGEISTGKSALINALVGDCVAQVDVRGGWTKEAWHVAWEGCGYVMQGMADSQVVLIDTPGLNEVGGESRKQIASEATQRADLTLFVTDSDLNDTEFSALLQLAAGHKPIILVINKIDLYSPSQRQRLIEVVRDERLTDILPAKNVVIAAADPREIEYVIESPDGSTRSEWRKPPPMVEDVKARILEILQRDGLALVALNAAMYAADKTDRVAHLRVELREARANQAIWSFAIVKSLAVAVNPVPIADVLGGTAVDVSMVVTLAHVYGLEMTWTNARVLVSSIAKAAGWVMLGEAATHVASNLFKALTFGYGTVLTAIPQGAAAGYGSYIVGQAAKYYFQHGASWGPEGPKSVVRRILDETDKDSVLDTLKDEIRKKLQPGGRGPARSSATPTRE